MNTQAYPLLDVFMEELNKTNHTKQEEIAIHRLRMLMKSPYAVELLNCALSTLLGHPIPIESETTDKAIDFLIERNEIDIEQSYHNEYEKEKVKAEMKATLNTLRNVIKDYLSSKGLLK